MSFYSPTQLGRLAGSCYLFLGHPERAEPLLDATAKALHSRHKTRSLVLGNLALAYLRQRQREATTATLHEAIEDVSMPTGPDAKQAIRQRVWDRLWQEGANMDHHGRIPDFVGATASADRLATLPVWQKAHVLKANPDQAQLPVRARALREGKLVYMAVPKLADPLPFFRLDPAELGGESETIAAHRTAATAAPKVAVSDMHTIDLIVCGSVAVNRDGVRIGKGAGYSDIEVGLLAEAALIGPPTTIVTTVHQLQVLDESLPHDEHDFTVDYIITPEEIIHCGPPHRPTGVMWTALDRDKITAIPVLAAMANKR